MGLLREESVAHQDAWWFGNYSVRCIPRIETTDERQERWRQCEVERAARLEILVRQVAAGRRLDYDRCSRQLAGQESLDEVPELQSQSQPLPAPQPIPIEVGRRVRERRLRAGWSQDALGRCTGVGHSTISRIECGHGKNRNFLALLARVLGCSVQWLLTGEEEQARAA